MRNHQTHQRTRKQRGPLGQKRREEKRIARFFWIALFIPAILPILATSGIAEPGNPVSSQPLLTTDPIAQVPWLSVADWHSPSFHGATAGNNALTIRLLLPLENGPFNHVVRITIPFSVKAPPTTETGRLI